MHGMHTQDFGCFDVKPCFFQVAENEGIKSTAPADEKVFNVG